MTDLPAWRVENLRNSKSISGVPTASIAWFMEGAASNFAVMYDSFAVRGYAKNT